MYYKTYGGVVVEAQRIVEFVFDKKTTTKYVILEDGSKVLQPKVHGNAPQVGDFLVQTPPPATLLRNGKVYQEPTVDAAIIPQSDFSNLYTPIPPTPEIVEPNVPAAEISEQTQKDREYLNQLSTWLKEPYGTKMPEELKAAAAEIEPVVALPEILTDPEKVLSEQVFTPFLEICAESLDVPEITPIEAETVPTSEITEVADSIAPVTEPTEPAQE
jgi:hypothetical protein